MILANANIDTLRHRAALGVLGLLWLHPPLLLAVSVATGGAWLGPLVVSLVLAGVTTALWITAGDTISYRYTSAVALVGMVSLLVFELDGNAWQVDMHMYFFATLAILAAYCDWRVLILGAGAIAIHHLVLNFLLPAALYPGGGNLGRVVLHAVIVILETGVLIWLAYQIESALAVSEAALRDAEAARRAEAVQRDQAASALAQAAAADRAARSSLTHRFEAEVGGLVGDVASAVAQVRDNAERLAVTAQTSAASTQTIVLASEETAQNVQTVAAAAEELAASVSEISSQMSRAAEIAGEAVAETGRTTETIHRLADMASRIETVVNLINGIAGQTNLLALNATIEAARAAEAGKGFAVVASEVKTLATQTARATDDIRAQIASIQSETHLAVTAIGGIARIVEDLTQITGAVATSIDQQGQATSEIARSAQKASVGTEAIARSIADLSQAADQTGSAARAGSSASDELSVNWEKVDRSVKTFVESLRAA